MSDHDITKVGRQNKGVPKARFELLLWTTNYDFLCRLAKAEGLSMAACMNQILSRLRSGVPQRTIETE